MKKIIILGLMLIFILSSCSIDWSGNKDKKIAELENQVEEMKSEKKGFIGKNTRMFTVGRKNA